MPCPRLASRPRQTPYIQRCPVFLRMRVLRVLRTRLRSDAHQIGLEARREEPATLASPRFALHTVGSLVLHTAPPRTAATFASCPGHHRSFTPASFVFWTPWAFPWSIHHVRLHVSQTCRQTNESPITLRGNGLQLPES